MALQGYVLQRFGYKFPTISTYNLLYATNYKENFKWDHCQVDEVVAVFCFFFRLFGSYDLTK